MKLAGLALRKRWLARKNFAAPFDRLLAAPLPPASTRFGNAELVCLDIETTGLDPASAEILSIGWVLIRANQVDIGTARSVLVRPETEVGASAEVHGLTDTLVEAGTELATAIGQVVEVLTGRVLVVHHAPLDKALLDRSTRSVFGSALPVPVIDTLALERRRRARRDETSHRDSLRLSALREQYHLPYYGGHDCLADAIATAELLLAMVATHGGASRTRLGDLL